MKKILSISLLIISSFLLQAQEVKWETNLNNAIELSKKVNKPIMMFFTGSDWCGWCIRLQKEVFYLPEFSAWANKNVIPLEVDFPKRTPQAPELQQQNNQLQQFFQVGGFPTIWIVNATTENGQVNFEKLGSTGYVAGGPTAWIATADQILKTK